MNRFAPTRGIRTLEYPARDRHAFAVTWFARLVALLLLAVPTVVFGEAPAAVSIPNPGYRLGPNDVIRVQVFGEDDLTVEGKVGGDGRMNFPLLGPLQVGGRSVQELRDEVTTRLADGYIRDPKVAVYIIRYRNVYISGEVKTPGAYPYEEGLTVQKIISLAGGLTEKAEKHGIKVNRLTEGRVSTTEVYAGDLVLPDDTVIVAPMERFYVTGEVMRPGSYSYEEGLRVSKAITFAGGFTEKADKGRIRATRVTGGRAEVIVVTDETPLLPEDVLVVDAQNGKIFVSGEVRTPGGYPFKEGMTVHQALAMAGGLTEKAERGRLTVLRHDNGRETSVPAKLDTGLLPDDMVVVAEGQHVYVSGEVKAAGRYLYDTGLTVHKAVSMAGGVTEKGDQGAVKVTRLIEGHARTLEGKPEMTLLPDDIVVVEPQNQKVYVNGEVRTPGGYGYKSGLTVHQALAMAGGLTEKAERGGLTVVHHHNGLETSMPAKLETGLLPDDIVVVPEGQRVYVSGEVRTPGRYVYEPGMTLQKAISLAGGVTERAEHGMIKVTRFTDGQSGTFHGQPASVVLPEDIIVVEPQNQYRFYVSGEVRTPGGYAYKDGLTVHKAVAMAGGLTEKAERDTLKVLRVTNGQEVTLPVKLDSLVLPDDIIVVAEGQRIYVSGEVKVPGRYLYEKGLTAHKAVSMAGGVTEKGDQGVVKVTRLTEGQAQTLLAEPETVLSPDDIVVVEPQNQKFYVNGEVKAPGAYAYKPGLNVQKAIALAGGLSEKADRHRFKVVRAMHGRETTLPATLESQILPEDSIIVTEGQRFYVSGEVKAAGRYLYESGVTVQKAITMAGGFSEKADKAGMTVVRVNGKGLETLPVELDAVVQPDDLIVVSQAQKIYVNGEVKRPGDYSYEKGLTIHKAITMAGGFTDKAAERKTKVLRRINGREQSMRVKLEDQVLPEDIIVVPQSFF